MSSNDFSPGLAGVVAFETEIAEPDKDGGELRYRGVNIEDLVGNVPFEQVWGLLVDESLHPGLPYEHVDLERRTGGYIADLQSTLAALSGEWELDQFIDIDRRAGEGGSATPLVGCALGRRPVGSWRGPGARAPGDRRGGATRPRSGSSSSGAAS